MIERLNLPFPPTTNNLYANRKGGRYTTQRYMTWQRAADGYLLSQKRQVGLTALDGPYRLSIVLDCRNRATKAGKRRKIDCDNYCKSISDWLVQRQLVPDDSFCEGISVNWGYVGDGLCSVTVLPTSQVAMPANYRGAA